MPGVSPVVPEADQAPDVTQAIGTGHSLQIYADGCFEPVSGTGGWSFVALRDGEELASDCGGLERAANNAMELMAVLHAARWIDGNAPGEPAVIWSDSVYAVNGCNVLRPIWKSWGWRKAGSGSRARRRAIADQALWQSVDEVLSKNARVTIAWCKGHSGIAGNERADRLAESGRQSLLCGKAG